MVLRVMVLRVMVLNAMDLRVMDLSVMDLSSELEVVVLGHSLVYSVSGYLAVYTTLFYPIPVLWHG